MTRPKQLEFQAADSSTSVPRSPDGTSVDGNGTDNQDAKMKKLQKEVEHYRETSMNFHKSDRALKQTILQQRERILLLNEGLSLREAMADKQARIISQQRDLIMELRLERLKQLSTQGERREEKKEVKEEKEDDVWDSTLLPCIMMFMSLAIVTLAVAVVFISI
ncbi:hypothetical protein QR680_016805 [Steinernema hermaphroditum]|uniref:Uncharacterized protein n=1 Tax=Steinernema hermaphroditum TaxID=289476 RepID=A0AA39HES9_9BILA|nr:hypothetical protein QR680_016805 [Steinernema hermaphroditum]